MAAASPTSLDHPAGGPCQTKQQSPTGVSPPPDHNQRQQQASNNGLKRPRHDHRLTIVSRYAGYFDEAAGCEAPWWVGWTGVDGRASRLRLANRFWVHYQTNVKYLRKNANVIVTRWLSKQMLLILSEKQIYNWRIKLWCSLKKYAMSSLPAS